MLHWIATLTISALLAGAAWHKWQAFADFQRALAAYQLLPASQLRTASYAVVLSEALIAVLIWFSPIGAWSAAALFAGYAAAMGINLVRGRRDMDCGCGGAPIRISSHLLVRNGALVVLAVAGALSAPVAVGLTTAVIIVLAALSLLITYFTVNQLLANRSYWIHQKGTFA